MTNKMIARDSFEVNGAYSENEWSVTVYGTVALTLAGQTKRVRASLYLSNDTSSHVHGMLTAYGITGRYMTGTKAWPGSVTSRLGWENDTVQFGFDSRSGKHRKVSISFAA